MLRLVTTVIPMISACGGSSDPQVDAPRLIDAPRADAACMVGCDPLSPTPCSMASQRCTWLVENSPPRNGDAVCLPSGAIPVGIACSRDASGGDNCVKGATCYMSVCRQICDLAATATTCGTTLACKSTAF